MTVTIAGLTEDQNKALSAIDEWLTSFLAGETKQNFFLSGSAGTGKTYLTAYIVRHLGIHYDITPSTILACAFSHQAKRVLKKNVPSLNPITIASALKYRAVESKLCDSDFELLQELSQIKNRTDEQEQKYVYLQRKCKEILQDQLFFIPGGNTQDMGQYDLILIDEASVLSQEYYKAFTTMTYGKVPVIFIGDKNQLPPVGEDITVFEYNEVTFKSHLKQVCRYQGSVLEYANAILEHGTKAKIEDFVGDGQIELVNSSLMLKRRYISAVKEYGQSLVALSPYRNAAFHAAYDIRMAMAEDQGIEEPYAEGEILISNALWNFYGSVLCPTSTNVQVSKFIKTYAHVLKDWDIYRLELYDMDEKQLIYDKQGYCAKADVLSYEDRYIYDELLGSISGLAFNVSKKGKLSLEDDLLKNYFQNTEVTAKDQKELFRLYYDLRSRIAPFVYPWGRTIHFAQGSTYDCVFLLNYRKYASMRKGKGWHPERLLYTAVTRTAKKLIVDMS